MIVCMPVNEDNAFASTLSGHFGSTPMFMLVDSATGDCRAIPNANQHHAPGTCAPLASLAGEEMDVVVVRGIGKGALDRLAAAGVRVLQTEAVSVGAVMTALEAGVLEPMRADMARCNHGPAGH